MAESSAPWSTFCVREARLRWRLFACASGGVPPEACADGEPGSPGFDVHQGYEADLLTALEAMDGAGVSFSRRGIGSWDDIWRASAGSGFDVTGGGITILHSRTRDAQGREAVVFTSGHITFRQSLPARAEDESGFMSYDDLASDVRVGALAGTTGEARLLEMTGLTDSNGALAAGVIIETPRGEVVEDGASNYRITAAVRKAASAAGMSQARSTALSRRWPRECASDTTPSRVDSNWRVIRPRSSAMMID